jgi:hypothetical protein
MSSAKMQPNLSLAELRKYEPHLTLTHVGDYDACVMVFSVDAALVTSLLPPDLELRPQSITPAGKHPVLLFVGEQAQVRGVLVPGEFCRWLTPIGLCMKFLEAAIAIPYVRQIGVSATIPDHFCSVKLYLNEALPVYLGRLCGFPKIKGLLSRTGNSYEVKTESGDPLLDLTFTPHGAFLAPSAFPHFGPLRPMFEQPHIGQLFSLLTPLLATYVCASMDLRLATATLQSVDISGEITEEFSTVLPNTFSFGGIENQALGAFRIRTTWELPPPTAC